MGRAAVDPTPRLEILAAARERVEAGEIVNADEMASIAGMTWRNMKPMVESDNGWPLIRRGSEGVAWEFDPAAVLDHMIAKGRATIAAKAERNERMAKMAGYNLPETVAALLEVGDLVKIDQLQTSAQRRKIEQRRYVLRDDAEAAISGLFTTLQSEILATVSRLDPAGRWPPQTRTDVAEAMRGLLVRLHDQLGEWLKPNDARPAPRPRKRARASRRGQVHS